MAAEGAQDIPPGAAEGAQERSATGAVAHPGEALTVSILTAEPGDAYWERFGHNGIRIVNSSTGEDVMWNWGLFSFDQPGFLNRLIKGTMLYSMGSVSTATMLADYGGSSRAVWEQELDLSPEERWSLQNAILVNALAENREYRYDYYRDNCSTRVRDMIDLAIGGRIAAGVGQGETGTSFRFHTRRLLQDVPWAYAGIEFVLGNRADEPISVWEEMFLPMRLRAYLDSVTVVQGGTERPLVKEHRQLARSTRPPVHRRSPSRAGVFFMVGLVWTGLIALSTRAAGPGSPLGRVSFVIAAGSWCVVSGIGGLVLLGAWAWTDHVFWGMNENVLQTDPLALVVAAGLPVLVVRGRLPAWVPKVAMVVAVLSVLGLAIQVLPGFDQVNGGILALALPPNLALAWATREMDRGPGPLGALAE